jgi:hypothetical protein
MIIQVFSEYLQQAQAGNVEFLACPMHMQEEAVFALVHSETKEGYIMLQCYACGYKNLAGLTLYNNILDRLDKLRPKIEPKKMSASQEDHV